MKAFDIYFLGKHSWTRSQRGWFILAFARIANNTQSLTAQQRVSSHTLIRFVQIIKVLFSLDQHLFLKLYPQDWMMNPYQPLSTHYKSQKLLCQRELVSKFTFVSSVIKHGEDIPCSLKVLFPKITPSISLYSLPVSTLLISEKCLCHRRLASQT